MACLAQTGWMLGSSVKGSIMLQLQEKYSALANHAEVSVAFKSLPTELEGADAHLALAGASGVFFTSGG